MTVGAFGREAFHRGGGGLRAALGRVAGPDVLGGVDADQAHVGELAGAAADPQGVAVDGVGDLRSDCDAGGVRRHLRRRGRRAAHRTRGDDSSNDGREGLHC